MGLNLRNIAWHGFLSPHEANPAFVATIITVLVDCGRLLKERYEIADIPVRPLALFKEVRYTYIYSFASSIPFPTGKTTFLM